MHHELPERLDVDWYRARARELLRQARAGEAAALERIGDRSSPKLADAQHAIALEHGFAKWADFKRWIETRAPEPPVGRIGRAPIASHEQRAAELAANPSEPDNIRRVRHHVPRLATFDGASLALRDARLVIAREYGFPSWRDLIYYAQKAIDEYEHRPSGALGQAFELIRAGDVDGLERMLDADPTLVHAQYRGAAATLLEAIAQPDVFGDHLSVELGVDARIVTLLIERGSALEVPLNLGACFNRAELVRMLLAAGADPTDTRTWSVTPLQTAVYHGAREAADLLAEVALVPDALYIAAASGRLDQLDKWFDPSGGLVPAALRTRPNLADVGWPPAPPPLDDPQAVLDEAFALSAYSGRIEALEYLLARGARVDGTVHLGMTALHMTVITRRLETARWLIAHGANVALTERIHHGTPLGWAEHSAAGSPIHAYLKSLA